MSTKPATVGHAREGSSYLDVGGALTIRLVNASEKHRRRVAAQLNACEVTPSAPHITVQFVDRVASGAICRQGLIHTGWRGDDYYLLDRSTGVARASLPIGHLEGAVEMTCATTERNVPGLAELVRLKLLDEGFVAAHASAVRHEGLGLVPMGWAKGGKTGAVLAFAHQGAAFVGDEWIGFSADGTTMFGIGQSIKVTDRNLDLFPRAAATVGHTQRLLWRIGRGLERRELRPLAAVMPRVTERFAIRAKAGEVFAVPLEASHSSPDVLFLMINTDVDQVRVEPMATRELAERMAAVGSFERSVLNRWYEGFRYAFPGRRDPVLDGAPEREQAMLEQAFAGKPAFTVAHRHPGPLEPLFAAMVEVVR